MKLSTIILASACYAATLPTYAQEPAQAPAPTRMQYENWQQLPHKFVQPYSLLWQPGSTAWQQQMNRGWPRTLQLTPYSRAGA